MVRTVVPTIHFVKHYGSAMTHHLVGLAEVAAILGVGKARVNQLEVTKGFPEPVVRLAAGPVWEREAIEEWATATGRKIVDLDE